MLSCTKNTDAMGTVGTYTLFPDALAQHASFDDEARSTRVLNCPGNIQSPGPWRRLRQAEWCKPSLIEALGVSLPNH
jgi:hypothetical protein